jgi:NTE family protein
MDENEEMLGSDGGGAVPSNATDYLARAPVETIPTDSLLDEPQAGIALCLSGGGYRAMLFHLGALWRLNESGLLPKLSRISSVSGGSITAGALGLAWPKLDFDGDGKARHFRNEVAEPVYRLAGKTIDIPAAVLGLLGPGTPGDYVALGYRIFLFSGHKLGSLPDENHTPRFLFNASNLQSGALWRFSKFYARDYRVGLIENPDITIAVAVAASSAFPPFLSPMVLRFKEKDYTHDPEAKLHFREYTSRVVLTDGGVYDNLGLETAWKRYKTILVSDRGGKMGPSKRPGHDWIRQFFRIRDLTDNQVRSLRKRQLYASYNLAPGVPGHRYGAYWSIRANLEQPNIPEVPSWPYCETSKLANEPTRLAHLNDDVRRKLINWGFATCDAALRGAILRGQLQLELKSQIQASVTLPFN